jgi:hypothetical protein
MKLQIRGDYKCVDLSAHGRWGSGVGKVCKGGVKTCWGLRISRVKEVKLVL